MNYRFWKTVNGSPVKITVPEGEALRCAVSRAERDGNTNCTYFTVTHSPEGVETETESRSYCPTDGRYGWDSYDLIPKGFLATNKHRGLLWPTYVWTGIHDDRGLWCPVQHLGDNEEW